MKQDFGVLGFRFRAEDLEFGASDVMLSGLVYSGLGV